MGIKVKFESKVPQAMRAMSGELEHRMHSAVEMVKDHVEQNKLAGDRSGRIYRIPGTRKTYTASAPGEPPASRTGELRQHIGTKVEQRGRKISGQVGTDVEHGTFLEKGTRDILPRPWLEPSFEETQGQLISIFTRPYKGGKL